ncbi:MAG TPA: ATP-binding protein, partial [Sphingomonas sp.]
ATRAADGVRLAVMDEGDGIPAGQERAIFETFRRIEGSDRAKGGTGLGLAIVKGFAEAMGLRVDAANRARPRGACFTIHIPNDLLVDDLDEGAL